MRQTRRGFLGTIAAIAAAVPLAGKAEAAPEKPAVASGNLSVTGNAVVTGTLTPGANLVSGSGFRVVQPGDPANPMHVQQIKNWADTYRQPSVGTLRLPNDAPLGREV